MYLLKKINVKNKYRKIEKKTTTTTTTLKPFKLQQQQQQQLFFFFLKLKRFTQNPKAELKKL